MTWLRRARVPLAILGVLALIGVGTWWALPQLWSLPNAPGIAAVDTDPPLDDLWASPQIEAPPSSTSSSPETSEGTEDPDAGLGLTRERGRLALQIDGERMGAEVYELSQPRQGQVQLASRGHFSLKLWFATVKFHYTQRVRMDSAWHPERYQLDLTGPLGLGNRHIRAELSERRARIKTGSRAHTVSLPEGPMTFIGVLASYAFLPKLIADRDRRRVTAIVFDVREPDPSLEQSIPAVPVEIAHQGSATLDSVAGDASVETARYDMDIIDEPESDLTMYAQRGTFVALDGRFSPDEPPFRIYRTDRLPGGFSVRSSP